MSGKKQKPMLQTGYTGFRPKALQPASQQVSGELSAFVADPRQTKFRRSAVEIIEPNQYATNSSLTQNSVTKADYLNRAKPAKMPVRDNNPSKEFYGVSGSAQDFVNFQSQIKAFADEDPDQYRSLFDRMDADGSGFLDKKELRAALKKRNVNSRYIVDTLMAHFDSNNDGKVSWGEFLFGLEKAKEQLVQSVNFKQVSGKTKPSWELKKSKEIEVVSVEERVSMASNDFTKGGFSQKPMTDGTSQATGHVPGYSGHLPASQFNDRAKGQMAGEAPRPDKGNLILIETYNPKVKAFTEVKYGKMKTMNSVNDRLVTNMWSERERRSGK